MPKMIKTNKYSLIFMGILTVSMVVMVSGVVAGPVGGPPPGVVPMAASGTLGDMIKNWFNNSGNLVPLFNLMAYILGTFFVALGLKKSKDHVDMGPQNMPLVEPIKFLMTGGALLAFPSIAGLVQNAFGSTNALPNFNLSTNPNAPGVSLSQMFLNLMRDTYGPTVLGAQIFCYIAGVAFVLIGLHRFTKSAQEGPRGPTGLGTIATFLMAGVFLSIAPSVDMMVRTLYGGSNLMTNVNFLALNASMSPVAQAHAQNVVVSILAFLIIVGILSIIRGVFILRGVAEGTQQMTMMGGVSHVIAGAILVNFGQFANMVQNTLGVGQFGVLFN